MKKLIALILTLIMLTVALTSCGGGTTATEINIAVMKGPTGMGMLKLMEDSANNAAKGKYNFDVKTTADEITPMLVQGKLDMATVPANLASILHHNTDGKIQILAVNTLGVLYIVEKNTAITSFEDLRGKTIYATGKGSVTEWNLRYLLSSNGIDPDNDVTIEFKSEATEVVATLKTVESGVAMLPQPYVTIAKTSIPELNIALNLTEEWDALESGSRMVTGVIVARKEFVEQNKAAVDQFLQEYETSINYVNENTEEAASLTEKYLGIKAGVAKQALPYCNITFISGAEMKSVVEAYLAVLMSQKAQSIGGSLPTDDFYYGAE